MGISLLSIFLDKLARRDFSKLSASVILGFLFGFNLVITVPNADTSLLKSIHPAANGANFTHSSPVVGIPMFFNMSY